MKLVILCYNNNIYKQGVASDKIDHNAFDYNDID